jgi:hypothetical protein
MASRREPGPASLPFVTTSVVEGLVVAALWAAPSAAGGKASPDANRAVVIKVNALRLNGRSGLIDIVPPFLQVPTTPQP